MFSYKILIWNNLDVLYQLLMFAYKCVVYIPWVRSILLNCIWFTPLKHFGPPQHYRSEGFKGGRRGREPLAFRVTADIFFFQSGVPFVCLSNFMEKIYKNFIKYTALSTCLTPYRSRAYKKGIPWYLLRKKMELPCYRKHKKNTLSK